MLLKNWGPLLLKADIDPLEDSDATMARFIEHCKDSETLASFLACDESECPGIERSWRIPEFPDDLLDLAIRSWRTVGRTVNSVRQWLNAPVFDLSLDCAHDRQLVKMRLYDRHTVWEKVTGRRPEA